MRLAVKWDGMTGDDAGVGGVPEMFTEVSADGSQASPAAALTAGLIQRGKGVWRGVDATVRGLQAAPEGRPELAGARAQQTHLVEAYAAPEPVTPLPAIDHAEFQSVREAAADWPLFRAPSANFWERFLKDVSIFTIFFAILVFVILQIM